jgi:hypothetical protein
MAELSIRLQSMGVHPLVALEMPHQIGQRLDLFLRGEISIVAMNLDTVMVFCFCRVVNGQVVPDQQVGGKGFTRLDYPADGSYPAPG